MTNFHPQKLRKVYEQKNKENKDRGTEREQEKSNME